MNKWLMIGALLIAFPVIAALAEPRPSLPGPWVPQQGEGDTLHGIWMVNASSGQVYRCGQFAASAVCVEAKMVTAEQWNHPAQQQPAR